MLECADVRKFLDRTTRDLRNEKVSGAVVVSYLRVLVSFFQILSEFRANQAFNGIAHALGAMMSTFERIPPLAMIPDGVIRKEIMQMRGGIADLISVLSASLEKILAENHDEFYLFVQKAYQVVGTIEVLSLELLGSISPPGMMAQ